MLKAQIVLDALARSLALTVQPGDLDREFARLAGEHRTDVKRIAELVREQGTLPVLVGDVLRRRAIDMIVEAAKVTGGPDDATLRRLGLLADEGSASDADTDIDADTDEGSASDAGEDGSGEG